MRRYVLGGAPAAEPTIGADGALPSTFYVLEGGVHGPAKKRCTSDVWSTVKRLTPEGVAHFTQIMNLKPDRSTLCRSSKQNRSPTMSMVRQMGHQMMMSERSPRVTRLSSIL